MATSGCNLTSRAEPTIESLARRADEICGKRPAYGEILGFYLKLFRRQLEWQSKVVVRPASVEPEQALACAADDTALATLFDPGLDVASLVGLWGEMKGLFREGNRVLREVIGKVDEAERRGDFEPGPWLASIRPGRPQIVAEVAGRIGVAAEVLETLACAVTLPHWNAVSRLWWPADAARKCRRLRCPVCDGVPALGELRTVPSAQADGKAAPQRNIHCSFCGTLWTPPALQCMACGSTHAGDSKYYYSPQETGERIEFCGKCKCYLKVLDGDRIPGPLHVGLELVATAHLDRVAADNGLKPSCSSGWSPQRRKETRQ